MFTQWKDAGCAEKQEKICKDNWKAWVLPKKKLPGLTSGKVLA